MTERHDVTDILRDIAVLYELSLSVGRSIHLVENCEGFLRTLMARKNLDFASIWIHARFVSDAGTEGLQLAYAHPSFRASTATMPPHHPIVRRLEEEPFYSVKHGSPDFEGVVQESGIDRGAYSIYRLGAIGFLKLYSVTRDAEVSNFELSKLRHVIDKFTVSLEGCLDHARVRAAEDRRRELEQQILHTQKLESLGLLAGGVAHDFNNLLSIILGNAELARDGLPDGSPELDNILTATDRATDLCSQLLAYSGRRHFDRQPLALNDVVEEMLRLTTITVSKKARNLPSLGEGLPPILGDRSQVVQIVMNLITNASEALADQSGSIRIRTGRARSEAEDLVEYRLADTLDGPDLVFLEIEDTGCGMDEEHLVRLFDPFFTTKFTGRGLGLAAVLGIVRGHRGAIRVQSTPGEGTRVRILFPIASRPATGPSVAAPTSAQERSGTVLVVDDERPVREVLGRHLSRLGFDTLFASDGAEALEVYGERRAEIDLVVLDLTMPVLDGRETYERLRLQNPDVRVVFTSGFALHESSPAESPTTAFLPKPFRSEDLVRVIDRISTARRRSSTRPRSSS